MSNWYVVHTHPHAEVKAMGHLIRQGFSAYLPQCERRSVMPGRSRQSCARFSHATCSSLDLLTDRWRPVLSTVGVCDLVRRGDAPSCRSRPWSAQETCTREADGAFRTEGLVRQFAPGDRVRIVGGAFADLVGRFWYERT
ncbi:MAG: transcription termination/antitermination NusG family protein [Alphaproteobacteria bacterium]